MRNARRLAGLYLLPLALTGGCASLWEEVSSRNFSPKNLFVRRDPLVVLRDSDDGYERAKALAALREPLQNGGTQQEQEVHVQILTKSALGDRDPYCRIAAIRALGHFQDPRAAEALRSVTEQKLNFTSEVNNLVRVEALQALAQTGQPTAVERLVQVAKEPPAEGSSQDQQEVLDRRLVAIRGLGRYNSPQATNTLLAILENERDAALRMRAHESLVAVTGKNYPPEARAWAIYLHPEQRREGEELAREQPGKVWDVVTWPIRQVRGY
jgi:hypothetical protein